MAIWKKITQISVAILLAVFSFAALAGGPAVAPAYPPFPRGLYFGAQAGYGSVHYTNTTLPAGFGATQIRNSGFTPRVYLGYDFLPYLGVELTVVYMEKPEFTGIAGTRGTQIIRNNIIALFLKAGYVVMPRWRVYIKIGPGYVAREGIKSTLGVTVLSDREIFRPVYGVGTDVQVYKRWYADVTWIQAAPSHRDRLPATNFIGAGVYFKFV